ncbi:MAG: hypothetical protein Q9162_002119 [Coniocarpon cinnabarinum]
MHIEAIYHYPIKSLRGVSVSEVTLTPRGLPHDRTFMLLRDHGEGNKHPKSGTRYENMHVSGFPQMCLFTTAIRKAVPTSSNDDGDSKDDAEKEDCIEITYTDPSTHSQSTLLIPLVPDIEALHLTRVFVRMHQSPTLAFAMPSHYSQWFSNIFGFTVVLAYLGHDEMAQTRPVLGNVAPNAVDVNNQRQQKLEMRRRAEHAEAERRRQRASKRGTWLGGVLESWVPSYFTSSSADINADGTEAEEMPTDEHDAENLLEARELRQDASKHYELSFADCAPYLLASSASLRDVAERLSDDEGNRLDIARFRPNIVIGGVDEAWVEDMWSEVRFSSASAATHVPQRMHERSDAMLHLTANCVRCPSLNVNYSTGEADGTVLKSLMKDRRVDKGMKWSPVFGRYGFLNGDEHVQLSVGDGVEVTAKNLEHAKTIWPGMSGTPKEIWFPS